ncbi:protein EDS1-like [Abrus precatorius]|uniref:Protein EDS1-like n=1 Tax=Abrus precatorius TaxID=3816 RepID=A0A8B8K967_ABRPR|nr:protein EDS1-like [Abrus precatorius]
MATRSGSGESIEMKGERIQRAFGEAFKAHKSPEKPFNHEDFSRFNPPEVIISFPASGAVKDWYSQRNFGETKINLGLFPSIKSIGNDEAALVNKAFLKRFEDILAKSTLADKVEKAMTKQEQIVFAGHSSGAPIAILATLWVLEKYQRLKSRRGIPPICITFGSPLVGNHIFSHATRRENWSHYFLHYVMRYDIVPRILLSPLSSLDQRFEPVSQSFNPKSKSFMSESIGRATSASDFHFAIMSNVATVTSHAACKLMGSTDTTLETFANFIPLSPYRPFGTYVFCTGNGKLGKQIVIKNPDAVLQLLFFSAQLSSEAEAAQVPYRSLREHSIYGTELQQTSHNVVHLDDKLKKLLSSDDAPRALNDLDLSPKAGLCLWAAAELEVRRLDNEDKIKQKKNFVEEKLKDLEKYREMWEHLKVGYYDGFREHKKTEDFKANVMRLELAGVWDEIIEKLRSYELSHEFEGNREWFDLGTRFRQLVEPLDIANYYRHLRHYENESSSYMVKGRPKRYRYTQRWLEHAQLRPQEPNSASCFWAEVEDLRFMMSNNNKSFEEVKERVVKLEGQIETWSEDGELAKDALLEGSTLVKWLKTLPPQHKRESCIRNLIKE